MSEEIEHPARYAADHPDRAAIIHGPTGEVTTYAQLDERSRRAANLLRARGLEVGSHLALMVDNRPEMLELMWAGMRAGCYVTPINWHLSAAEAGYIIEDCGASVVVASAAVADVVAQIELDAMAGRFSVGGDIPGFEDLEAALAEQPAEPTAPEREGSWMFYSSGTTGKPKGVKPPTVGEPLGAPQGFSMMVRYLFGGGEDTVYLSPAPLYHAAPAGWTTTMHRLGGTAVLMDRFDPHEVLALIERHRVTHVQFVPTHLVRLLKLSEEERSRYDLSSLRVVVHAAAPCPVEVKRAAIEWLGPIVHEYYSGSEGVGFCAIGPEEWLEHPGSVGKSLMGPIHILDPEGNELPPREEGQVWFEPPQRFEYHGDPAKTAEAYNPQGYATIGDMGWVDEDGYLYLTDRVSNMIISGGVNVYPREVEDVLVAHPAVADVAAIGVPHPDLGETVRAVVQLAEGASPGDALADELIAHCRDRIAHFKCPTSVVFVDELPRLPTGKLAKRLLPDDVRGVTA